MGGGVRASGNRRGSPLRLRRRAFVGGAAALGAASVLPFDGGARAAPAITGAFSFDALSAAMEARAGEPYVAPEPANGFIESLTYDQYRDINFRPDRSRWRGQDRRFWLQAFHMGWLFDTPVALLEVVDGEVRSLDFTSDDFKYTDTAEGLVGPGTPLPGVSGFRLNTPINRPGFFDELVAFQGASYFRALGRGNTYGLSARGLAINTATGADEEFPRFSTFYAVRPAPGEGSVTICAELDSESVAGAYRFVVTPGRETAIEVTARLYFRREVDNLGVAPLTSMYLFSEANRSRFDDYRTQVHDSDGLQIRRANDDVLWRALTNPPRLATSYFSETSARGFGLHQRDRAFRDYHDAGAHYHDRPSVDVDFLGDWGPGAVRLVEIPTDLEINDNIVAYWSPQDPAPAGASQEWRYRLRWGAIEPPGGLAHVAGTRTGIGGVSGVENDGSTRKFVVDFAGGRLAALDAEAEADLEARVAVSRGEISTQALSKVEGTDIWRLVVDVTPEPDAATELVAYLQGYDERLTETWLYQWIEAP